MLKNYIKIAWRNLIKGKLYSAINIIGLAVGIACCLMIGLYVYQELRYDHFHEKSDQIYRVNHTRTSDSGTNRYAQTPKPLAPFLEDNFSEVKHAIRLQKEDGVIRIHNQLFKEQFLVAENGFLDVFDFELLQGNPETAFTAREQILLTKSAAQKLFGSVNATGKSLELRIDGQYYQASVGGILDDPPEYSSIKFNVVIPLEYWKKVDRSYESGNNWGTLRPVTYTLLNKESNSVKLAEKVDAKLRDQVLDQFTKSLSVEFQSLADIHFDNSVEATLEPTSNVSFIYISIAIAALILIIACINFTTLSIGHSARRAREVGMRKSMGARRSQIIKQFWGETVVVTLFALVLGLFITELLLPYFGQLVDTSLELNFFNNPLLLIMTAGVVLLTGLLAGSYPAIYLSKFRPSQVLRNKINIEGNYSLTNILTTAQFALAAILIIGTLFMNKQMDLMMDKNLGFNEEYVLQLPVPFEEGKAIMEDLRTSLQNRSDVLSVSGSWEQLTTEGVGFQAQSTTADGKEIQAYSFGIDTRMPETMELKVKSGRTFREDANADDTNNVLVNEELVRAFEWENPLGKQISQIFAFQDATIIGVVKNFHFQSLHQPIGPLVVYPNSHISGIYIRVQNGQINTTLDRIEKAWKAVAPGLPFNFTFLDDQIDRQYRKDQRWAQLVELSSIIAIVIAAMGLFGLATLATAKRAKEVSIRKVLGATVTSLAGLLSKDFLKPVILGLIIAIPVSYMLMSNWLQNFAYRVDLGIGVFVTAAFFTILTAIITVSWQSVRAALANPVDSLRNE